MDINKQPTQKNDNLIKIYKNWNKIQNMEW
jgi:hypothetical protein